jgi:hypothetical protein
MFVAGLGDLAVFPCSSLKKPLVKDWPKAAQRIEPPEDWIRVGVPTGPINGIDVVDIDPEGLEWFQRNRDALPVTRIHKTPRGFHVLFRAAEGLKGSADSRIVHGVDIRATGNLVVWWPRQGYEVIDAELAEWPEELLKLALGPVKTFRYPRGGGAHRVVGSSALAELNVLDYRNYEDWRNLMMAAHSAGIDKEEFIDWSTEDPLYANDADEIAQMWDALRRDGGITEWYLRVDVRLAQMNKGIWPKRIPITHIPIDAHTSGGTSIQAISPNHRSQWPCQLLAK